MSSSLVHLYDTKPEFQIKTFPYSSFYSSYDNPIAL